MSASVETIREKVRELAEQLLVDATWDDAIEVARFRRAVETGIAAADRGAFASDDEVRAAFKKMGREGLTLRWTRPALADLLEAQEQNAKENSLAAHDVA